MPAPGVDDDQDPAQGVEAYRCEAFLAVVARIARRQRQIVKKDEGCVGEVDAMFLRFAAALPSSHSKPTESKYMHRRAYKIKEAAISPGT